MVGMAAFLTRRNEGKEDERKGKKDGSNERVCVMEEGRETKRIENDGREKKAATRLFRGLTRSGDASGSAWR